MANDLLQTLKSATNVRHVPICTTDNGKNYFKSCLTSKRAHNSVDLSISTKEFQRNIFSKILKFRNGWSLLRSNTLRTPQKLGWLLPYSTNNNYTTLVDCCAHSKYCLSILNIGWLSNIFTYTLSMTDSPCEGLVHVNSTLLQQDRFKNNQTTKMNIIVLL